MSNKYKYNKFLITFLLLFSSSIAMASSSSVAVRLPGTVVYHSDLEWNTGTSQSAARMATCAPGQAVVTPAQTKQNYTMHYIKDFKTSAMGIPVGWNYENTQATTETPQYSTTCKKLESKLNFYSGALP